MLAEKEMTGSLRRPRKIAVRDTGGGDGPSHLELGIALPYLGFVSRLGSDADPSQRGLGDCRRLSGGRRRCPEQCIHKGAALKILQILNRLPDSNQSHG